MLYVHMLFGLVVGLMAAGLGLLMGSSPWAAVFYLILGANVGLVACALGRQTAWSAPDRRRASEHGSGVSAGSAALLEGECGAELIGPSEN